MKYTFMKYLVLGLLCSSFLFLTACGGQGGDVSSALSSATGKSTSAVESTPDTEASESESTTGESVGASSTEQSQQSSPSKSTSTPPATSKPSGSVTSKSNTSTRRNLLKGWLGDIDITDKTKVYGWDPENRYITASHSLECSWGNGYGKGYLVDGVKTSNKQMFDQGVWVSCTINPGWGENSGTLDESTVTWRKSDLNEWLIFDLQKIYCVDQVNFSTLYHMTSHGMPQAFTIEVSTDKKKWTVVHKETEYFQDVSSADQAFPFKAVKARYVKLHFTEGSSLAIDKNLAYSAALSEVEIWGKDC